jgi:hypothetical protein
MTDEEAYRGWLARKNGVAATAHEAFLAGVKRYKELWLREQELNLQMEAELQSGSLPSSRYTFDPHNVFDQWLIRNFKTGDITSREHNLMFSVWYALKSDKENHND